MAEPSQASPGEQRKELEQSERDASRDQPKTFRDEAMEDKIVEIPPAGPNQKPIRGLDPK